MIRSVIVRKNGSAGNLASERRTCLAWGVSGVSPRKTWDIPCSPGRPPGLSQFPNWQHVVREILRPPRQVRHCRVFDIKAEVVVEGGEDFGEGGGSVGGVFAEAVGAPMTWPVRMPPPARREQETSDQWSRPHSSYRITSRVNASTPTTVVSQESTIR